MLRTSYVMENLYLALDCCFKLKFVDLVIRETIVAYLGSFQLLDLNITELKSHMTCYNPMPPIG